MLKVSFKESDFQTSKKVIVSNDLTTTVVILSGEVYLPSFLWHNIPRSVQKWMKSYNGVDTILGGSRFYITVSGKAKKAKEDTYNAILGERIAEAKAKIRLYRFMRNLCHELMVYFEKMLYGGEIHPETIYHKSEDRDNFLKTRTKYYDLLYDEEEHLHKLIQSANEPNSKSSS